MHLFHGRCRRVTLSLSGLLALAAAGLHSASATDLIDVYEQAAAYDASLQAATFEYDAAVERLPIARSAFLPQIGVGGELDYTWTRTDSGNDDYPSSLLTLSLTQSLFNRGNAALVDQAEISVMQAEAQLLAEQQNLILRVATAYFDVLRAEADLDFSRSELEAITRQLEQAERRFDVGLVPITDVRDAQAQADLAVAQEIAASNQLSTAREALRRISGIDAEELAPLAEDFPLNAPQPADIDAWVQIAVDQNLPLVIARYAAAAAREQVKVERGARYPIVDLVGAMSSSTTEQTDSTDFDAAEISLELRVPLYTGGRIKSLVAQAQANSLVAAEQQVEQERSTAQQARDGYRNVIASISRVKALKQALESTRQSAEATDAGFRAGTRTSVDVLRALRDTFSAQSDYASARYDYILNSLTLRSAAGTLNEGDLNAVNNYLVSVD